MGTRTGYPRGIIPPHMLREIAQRGGPEQRERALRALATTERIHAQRQMVGREMPAAAPLAAPGKQRSVYDGGHGASLPGQLVRSEGEPPTPDVAVNEAYDGAGATYDLYWEVFERNSVDNRGLPLISTVHYEVDYDNAFWDGRQMVYGDGDEDRPPAEQLFHRFTIAVDVIGHELTHGVTQYTANLAYAGQSGALNESFSDVFGSLVKQRLLNQTAATADWLIGEGLFTSNVHGVALRSLKAPGTAYDDPVLGKDPQPAHMKDYQNVSYDDGGVHINSGIPNHAFYLIATALGGYAWEKAGSIWYTALTDRLQSNASFQDAARVTFEIAGEMFGAGSAEQEAVRNGWAGVGLDVEGAVQNPGCLPTVPRAIRAFLGIGRRQ